MEIVSPEITTGFSGRSRARTITILLFKYFSIAVGSMMLLDGNSLTIV